MSGRAGVHAALACVCVLLGAVAAFGWQMIRAMPERVWVATESPVELVRKPLVWHARNRRWVTVSLPGIPPNALCSTESMLRVTSIQDAAGTAITGVRSLRDGNAGYVVLARQPRPSGLRWRRNLRFWDARSYVFTGRAEERGGVTFHEVTWQEDAQ